jgi:hypothetical protein
VPGVGGGGGGSGPKVELPEREFSSNGTVPNGVLKSSYRGGSPRSEPTGPKGSYIMSLATV